MPAKTGGLATLLPSTTITTAVTGSVGIAMPTEGLRDLIVEANFTYGSSGTSLKVWVQTRVQGETWRDIMAFAFTTSSVKKWSKTSISVALAAAVAASDAALADDTILAGFLGDEIFVFSPILKHSQFFDMIGGAVKHTLLAAGFVDENWDCFGESTSLDTKSRPALDGALLTMWHPKKK